MSTSFEDIGTQAPNNPNQHYIDPRVLSDAPTEADLARQTPEASGAAQNGVGEQMADTAMRSIDGPNSVGGKLTNFLGGHKITAAVAGLATVGAGAIGLGMHLGNAPTLNDRVGAIAPANPNDLKNEIQSDTIISANTLNPDRNGDGTVTSEEYDLMDPADYAKLPDTERVADTAEKLQRNMPRAWDIMSTYLTDTEKPVMYMPNLNKPMSEWSNQDYYNYHSIALWLVSTQGDTQPQIKEGRRAFSVVLGPTNGGFSDTMNSIGNVEAIHNVYQAQPATEGQPNSVELKPGMEIDDIEIGGDGGRLILGKYISDGPDKGNLGYDLFVNRRDYNGNVTPILAKSYSATDPAVQNLFLDK
jgi:hypothetical protein